MSGPSIVVPEAVTRPVCGLIIWESKRVIGDGAFSPGLEYDAEVYTSALKSNGFDTVNTRQPFDLFIHNFVCQLAQIS